MKSFQSFQNLCLCGLSCATYSENFYPDLLNGRGRQRKWQKNLSWKVNWRCFQVHCSYSMPFNLSNVGEFFLELNSKGVFLCYEKHTISLSCLHAVHKTWNKAVMARRSGAACDGIKMYKKAWFARIVVVLLLAKYLFDVQVGVPYLCPVHTNTSIDSLAYYYRHFDAFPTVHTQTFENRRNVRDVRWSWTLVYACHKQKHLRYFSRRFHFDAFLLFSTFHSNTVWMRFRFDPLSRVFSNRCVFDENAQRGSVDGRHDASKCMRFQKKSY